MSYPSYPGPIEPSGDGVQPPAYGYQPEQTGPPPYSNQPYPAPTSRIGELASWIQRVGAYLLDTVIANALSFGLGISLGVVALIAGADVESESFDTLVNGLAGLFALGWAFFNFGYLQGTTGSTIGKKALGIAVVRTDGTYMGVPLAIGRFFAHILDALPCGLGFLWPLWDAENRTFADMICNTRVRRTR